MTNSEKTYMQRVQETVQDGTVRGVLTGQVPIHMAKPHWTAEDQRRFDEAQNRADEDDYGSE